MAKAKTSAKAQTRNMTSEILDRLDQLEALVPPDAVEHALHRISSLEEAICPKVAARLLALERTVDVIRQDELNNHLSVDRVTSRLTVLERNVGERGEMPLPLFDCVRMQGQENLAVHQRFQRLEKQSVPSGTGHTKGAEDAKPAILPRNIRIRHAIKQKFGIDFTYQGLEELLSTIGGVVS